jgi:membrane-bound lytic murein transglycosylase A
VTGRARRLLALGLVALLAACSSANPPATSPGAAASPTSTARLTLTPASFADLPDWNRDGTAEALTAFLKSCGELDKRADNAVVGPATLGITAADWRAACRGAPTIAHNDAAARSFFERFFTPYRVGNNGTAEGLFTGYYEPLLRGSRQAGGAYRTQILRRPPDLVMVDLSRFRPAWKGERIGGRVEGGNLVPYASRKEIERGALDRLHLAMLWVDDPADAFFLQVQGSGRVNLTDGTSVRLGYDGQNGHPYVAIGKVLVERGALTVDKVSLQSIRAWMKAHPDQASSLMDENPSYVFFREAKGDGPTGSEGVVLTPGRSLAVDRSYIPLGAPVYIDAAQNGTAIHRLAVAQDTGGAITGPVRGDIFWGFGPDAEARAGTMRAPGRLYVLLPKNISSTKLPLVSNNSEEHGIETVRRNAG